MCRCFFLFSGFVCWLSRGVKHFPPSTRPPAPHPFIDVLHHRSRNFVTGGSVPSRLQSQKMDGWKIKKLPPRSEKKIPKASPKKTNNYRDSRFRCFNQKEAPDLWKLDSEIFLQSAFPWKKTASPRFFVPKTARSEEHQSRAAGWSTPAGRCKVLQSVAPGVEFFYRVHGRFPIMILLCL